MVAVKFHWEKEKTFLEGDTPKENVGFFYFLSYHLLIFSQRSHKTVLGTFKCHKYK